MQSRSIGSRNTEVDHRLVLGLYGIRAPSNLDGGTEGRAPAAFTGTTRCPRGITVVVVRGIAALALHSDGEPCVCSPRATNSQSSPDSRSGTS
jgi:hypothetical protein